MIIISKYPSDLSGLTFGKWTVLRQVGIYRLHSGEWSAKLFECRCECGKIQKVTKSSLTGGQSKSCKQCAYKTRTIRNKLPKGHAARNLVLRSYKRNAKIRGFKWNLSDELALSLMEKPCFYCGDLCANSVKGCYRSSFEYNGLDRLDNTKNYDADNVVTACAICNRAKMNLPVKDFYEWMKRLIVYSATKIVLDKSFGVW